MSALDILQGKTLLIVDDEPDLRGPLATNFELLGCRVFQAGNGRDAFALVNREKIDAVISDIRMPGGDGIELLERIKERNHEFPVMMLITGFSDLSREDAYHLGAEAILAKPFDLDELEQAVARILTRREELWRRPVDSSLLKKTIAQEFTDLSAALARGQLKLGRGGLFVHLPESHAAIGDWVALRIVFTSGECLVIEGAGVIRWVRLEEAHGLPRGCGIEFESLGEETRRQILQITTATPLRPFIPKG
jgi:DNA-binding response OmpR family regulator